MAVSASTAVRGNKLRTGGIFTLFIAGLVEHQLWSCCGISYVWSVLEARRKHEADSVRVAGNTNTFYFPQALILGSEGDETTAFLVSLLNHPRLDLQICSQNHCHPLTVQHLIKKLTAKSAALADMFPDLDAAGSSWVLMPEIVLSKGFFSPLDTVKSSCIRNLIRS